MISVFATEGSAIEPVGAHKKERMNWEVVLSKTSQCKLTATTLGAISKNVVESLATCTTSDMHPDPNRIHRHVVTH